MYFSQVVRYYTGDGTGEFSIQFWSLLNWASGSNCELGIAMRLLCWHFSLMCRLYILLAAWCRKISVMCRLVQAYTSHLQLNCSRHVPFMSRVMQTCGSYAEIFVLCADVGISLMCRQVQILCLMCRLVLHMYYVHQCAGISLTCWLVQILYVSCAG